MKTTDPHRARLLAMRDVLVRYLHVKVAAEDWHGVSDAANDLRELDAELRARKGQL